VSTDRDEKFLEVLAGRRAADDADTRRAELMGEYFDAHPVARHEPKRAFDDDKECLAHIRAGAARASAVVAERQPLPATAAAPPPAPGPAASLARWLGLSGPSSPALRYGTAAALVLVGVAVVFNITREADDSSGMRTLGGVTVYAARPAEEAEQVRALLAAQGVTAKLTPRERLVWLEADVPAEKRAAVEAALRARGITLPDDGRLRLRLTLKP
jgi:hypothetical protein